MSLIIASLRPREQYAGLESNIELFEADFVDIFLHTILWMVNGVTLNLLVELAGAILLKAAVAGRPPSASCRCRYGSARP